MLLVIEDHRGAPNGDPYALGKSIKKPRHRPLHHALRAVVLSHPKVIMLDQQAWTVASPSQREPEHSSLRWSLCRRHSAQLGTSTIATP